MIFPRPEVITALATVIYAVISAFLWRSTKRTADLTQAMLEASHRPFLGISIVWDFSGGYAEDGKPKTRVFFTISNHVPFLSLLRMGGYERDYFVQAHKVAQTSVNTAQT